MSSFLRSGGADPDASASSRAAGAFHGFPDLAELPPTSSTSKVAAGHRRIAKLEKK